MIRTATARRIASEWHSGQFTNLYAIASTCNLLTTKKNAIQEVEGCMMEVTSKKQLTELTNLHKFIGAKF